jgi:hypothetical protein
MAPVDVIFASEIIYERQVIQLSIVRLEFKKTIIVRERQ